MAPGYRAPMRKALIEIAGRYGKAKVEHLLPRHIAADLKDRPAGPRNARLKAWRALLNFGVDEAWIVTSPAALIRRSSTPKTDGFLRIPRDAKKKFRQHWPQGTPQRTAFEVISWTGARCVDACRLGRQMIDAQGFLCFTQRKTGGGVEIPISQAPLNEPFLRAEHEHLIEAMKHVGEMQFIVTKHGKPRSQKGLSQWLSRAMNEAGIDPRYSAHGLRKARAAELAELGWSSKRIAAWTGHESLSVVLVNTRSA